MGGCGRVGGAVIDRSLCQGAKNLVMNFFLKFEGWFLDGICSPLDLFLLDLRMPGS